MATRKSAVVGIDFSPQQIRIVEVQGRASSAHVLRAGSAPMPEGALVGDRIVEPEALALTLRRLLDTTGIVARDAVFGLTSGSVLTQVMNVPTVPPAELRMVLEGELEHYKIIRQGDGVFDYIRLNSSPDSENVIEAGETPMLLMAAEKTVVQAYQQVALLAGLRLVALEPTLLAMYRVGCRLPQSQPGVMCLSVDHSKSEVAVTEGGAIRLYRRVEVGSGGLFPTLFPANAAGQGGLPSRPQASILTEDMEEDEVNPLLHPAFNNPAYNSPTFQGAAMNMPAARTLSLEVRRSLEYYRRENPTSGGVESIVLVTDTPAMQTLQLWLSQDLGLPVTLARVADARGLQIHPTLNATQFRSTPDGDAKDIELLPALGLALGVLADQPAGVPHFDLSSEQMAQVVGAAARRILNLSLAASGLLLLVGGGIALGIAARTGAVGRDLARSQQELNTRQQQQQLVLSQWQQQQNEMQILQKKGFPFPRLMDAITSVVDPQTGLTNVTLDTAGKLTVEGNAVNDRAVVRTLEGLRTVDWFEIPSLDSLERKQIRSELPPEIDFKIITQVAGSRPAPTTQTGVLP